MSERKNINAAWSFTKDAVSVAEGSSVLAQGNWEVLDLPHTWNGTDGQDGGNDYYRGTCYYAKKMKKEEFGDFPVLYLEFNGANSSAVLYVNGKEAARHDGGYSTWRVNVTDLLQDDNEIVVAVDNAANDRVYPQMADFTFYGGLYRSVNVVGVPETHFDLDYYGGPAIMVTPKVEGKEAKVEVQVFVTNAEHDDVLEYVIKDGDQVVASAEVPADKMSESFTIENVHLWNGRKDPHLYTAVVTLKRNGKALDERITRFGCRSYVIDPEKGFILNGESYPLHGVSRHQDRPKKGNALSPEDHEEDIALILEMGANTIRLAHYQHDQHFYDLCDEKGLVIWAEIPYISKHMPNGRENTISQMTELITQNYNHACIVVWGLSNEITMGGGAEDEDLLENHRILNDLCHRLDPTRLTTMAVVSMCSMDSTYVQIPDVLSYNHYYGWYGGTTDMNGEFFDEFHKKYPNRAVGMSEYGCEALNWHTSNPVQGDYTEEYQAYYHEELIKQLFSRPFIWATHVWNMFDFAADSRAEGGENGMNHKGLVTFDRKYKKDAFYAYKAWLSEDPFVHICGKRYVDRVEDTTKVTVYSNQPEVELFVNGESLGRQTSDVHFFYFDVPNKGESVLTAKAGDCTDESKIRKVDTFNEAYRLKEEGEVINWFDINMPDGYYNINDTIESIMKVPEGQVFIGALLKGIMQNAGGEQAAAQAGVDGAGLMKMLGGFSVKRMLNLMGTAGGGKKYTREELLDLNAQLNKIKRA